MLVRVVSNMFRYSTEAAMLLLLSLYVNGRRKEIKEVFSEENYVPQPQFELASMLTVFIV